MGHSILRRKAHSDTFGEREGGGAEFKRKSTLRPADLAIPAHQPYEVATGKCLFIYKDLFRGYRYLKLLGPSVLGTVFEQIL